ncbi:hypothetical protein [Haloprofundus salinisoli]|uniref:hypothetical protein n=1 Tax=Haloprofundus salinisoli TaxID=2876193 RepID=UPI001CCA258B|nr:hypothetical protein [Haloprofundus salinisoli]
MKQVPRRTALRLGIAASLLGGGVGVYEVLGLGNEPKVTRKSGTGNKQWPFVDGQPSLSDGHGTLWAYLVNSEDTDSNLKWENWPTINDKELPRVDDFDRYALIVIVGVVKPGYELDETREPVYEDRTVEHTYTISETDGEYQNAAELSYHYDLIRWELNGAPAPEQVVLA